jgi:hypothetical protein
MLPAQWKAAYNDFPEGLDVLGLPALAESPGPDLWCYVCKHTYCRRHWVLMTVFESGYYDGTDGVCPEGHRSAEIER